MVLKMDHIKKPLKIQKSPLNDKNRPKNTKTPLKHKFWFWCSDFVFLRAILI